MFAPLSPGPHTLHFHGEFPSFNFLLDITYYLTVAAPRERVLATIPVGSGPASLGRQAMTAALMALMCFHAARFDARIDDDGQILTLRYQDRRRWDHELIGEGFRYLERSASGAEVSHIHIEAGIAAVHCMAESYARTDWKEIVRLYDRLMAIGPTPIVALNRAIAIGERDGPGAGLAAINAIPDTEPLESYYLFPAALGEMHLQLGKLEEARRFFERACTLTSSPAERQHLWRKLAACVSGQEGEI